MKIVCTFAIALSLFSPIIFAQQEDSALAIGIAVQQDAAYLGAKHTHVLPIPLVNWQQGPLFVRSGRGMEEAGAQWAINDNLSIGTQVAFELGRDTDDAEILQQLHMPDISYGVSGGVHIEYSTHIGPAPVDALLRLRQRSGEQRGALADMRIEVGVYGNRYVGVQTYIQGTWANQQAMNSDFGVEARNAAFAGIPEYQAEAGLRNYLIGVAGKLDFATEWMAIGAIEYNTLSSELVDSPVTEKKNSQAVTLGVMYKF